VDKQENKGFDEVRSEIEGKLKPQAAGQAVEKLRQEATVTLDEAYFGPATPAPAAGIGAPAAPPVAK
jgi:hypothetical protein